MDFKNYNRTQKQLILFFGGIGFCFTSFYLISEGFFGEYPQFWIIFLGSFFGIIGLYSIYVFFDYERFEEIESYKKKKDVSFLENKRLKRYIFLPLFVSGMLLIWVAYYFYSDIDTKLLKLDTVTINDIVTSKIELDKSGKSSKSIKINLKKYPEYRFWIVGVAFSATDSKNFIKNVKTGDTISVIIEKKEYQQKLTHEIELSFWDKTDNYGLISIYGINDKNYNYLTLEGYNESHKQDAPWGVWMFGLIGLYFLGSAMYSLND